MRLRELIKAVRATKTSAEERAVISRESAKIRTSFAQVGCPLLSWSFLWSLFGFLRECLWARRCWRCLWRFEQPSTSHHRDAE